MNKIIRDYLHDLLAHITYIEQFTTSGENAFMADRKTQFTVIRAYEVSGEIVKRLPKELLAEQPSVDWRRLVRFRDFLAHNYDRVVLNNVWAGVEDLPSLRRSVTEMLEKLETGEQ